ncbi:hypothetical protein, partial [Caballeronia arationis]|uniref:hypothetical protein n=1 Tax=Caballeronia arationis TaxID=1777142 RepID=UPI001F1F8568
NWEFRNCLSAPIRTLRLASRDSARPTNYLTTVLSFVVLGVIVGCKRLAPRLPGALIAVIGAIVGARCSNSPSMALR